MDNVIFVSLFLFRFDVVWFNFRIRFWYFWVLMGDDVIVVCLVFFSIRILFIILIIWFLFWKDLVLWVKFFLNIIFVDKVVIVGNSNNISSFVF